MSRRPNPVPAGPLRAATRATYVVFAASGFAFASWASRIPQFRDRLDLDPSALGLVLLALAAGSVLVLPLAGSAVARAGSRWTLLTAAVGLTVGMLVVAVGYGTGPVTVVAGLFVFGFANGAYDVAMNVQGAAVERRLGRSVMSRFHAAFSLGTVAGALAGAATVALHVPVTAHLVAVALLVAVAVGRTAPRFLPDVADPPTVVTTEFRPGHEKIEDGARPAWREPRTLLTGVLVLTFAFAEGTATDWLAVAAIDGHHASPAGGTLAFAAFLAAMTVGRWFGPVLLDRYGRVPVVRGLAVTAIAGALLFVLAPPPLAMAGTLLWGAGVSLGFPVGLSAGADDPARAPARVSVICAVGYLAFFAGPPAVGLLADHVTVLRALVVVPGLLGLAVLLAPVLRPPAQPGVTGQERKRWRA